MSKRALLVGCNYPGTSNELKGCINDVMRMKDCLLTRFGFDQEDVIVMIDTDQSYPQPTGANIRNALHKLVANTDPGDVLVLHYSGHGTQVPAESGHAADDKEEECIVPTDMNLLTDDDFRDIVNLVPDGVTFTFISDSCHSGGLIDHEKEQVGDRASGPATGSAPHATARFEQPNPTRDFQYPGGGDRDQDGGRGGYENQQERGYDRQEEHSEKYEEEHKRQGEHEREEKYDKYDKHEKHEKHEKHDKYDKYEEREEKHHQHRDSDEYEERERRGGEYEDQRSRRGEEEIPQYRNGAPPQQQYGYGGGGPQYSQQGAPPPQQYGYGGAGPQYPQQGAPPQQQYGYAGGPPQYPQYGAPPPLQYGYGAPPPQYPQYGAPPQQQYDYGGGPPQYPQQGAPPQQYGYGGGPPQNPQYGAPPPQYQGAPALYGRSGPGGGLNPTIRSSNRSLDLNSLLSMLSQRSGQQVGVGNIRTTLFSMFGKDASPMVQSFVGVLMKHAPEIMATLEGGGGLKAAFGIVGRVGIEFLKGQMAGGGGNGMANVTPHSQYVASMGPQVAYAGMKPPQNLRVAEDMGILVSGCQANETSADADPSGNPREAYGALSNAIQRVLQRQQGPIRNRDLVVACREILQEQGFTQHPCLYCSDSNAEALFICG